LVLWIILAHAEETHLTASWYSVASLKKDGQWKLTKGRCADGSMFSDDNFTCASWDFKLGDRLLVRTNDKEVIVIVTDRTHRRFKGRRIDLSPKAFSLLAPLRQGIIKVRVEKLYGLDK
jgi:rare lipoprotein A (peptidoglycan hydrolase)